MYSYSNDIPTVTKYNKHQWAVPYCIEAVTAGEGEEAIEQYRSKTLLVTRINNITNDIVGVLNSDVNTYIHGYYDAGTQQTFQALIAMDSVPQAVKDDIWLIWPWIQSALAYYYGKKAEVLSAEDPKTVTWDFSQFDATKPDVTLAGIMAELAG